MEAPRYYFDDEVPESDEVNERFADWDWNVPNSEQP